MSSAIGAAGIALATLLDTAAANPAHALYQAQIAFSPPDQYESNAVVALMGLADLDEVYRVLGPQPSKRDETFGLLVGIDYYKPEGTDREAWSAGWALYEGIRTVVQANPTLSGSVFLAQSVPRDATGAVRPLKDDGDRKPGFAIRIDLAVMCRYRTA